MTLRPVVHAYGLARTASDPSEDAYAVEAASGRVALADGASSAWRAGDWAAALSAAWVAHDPAAVGERADGWLDAARTAFSAGDAEPGTRPWFADAAAERGAHAAFLGLALVDLDGARPMWRTHAVGDVCAFHVRDGRLRTATPIADPARFTSRPDLLTSLPDVPTPAPTRAEGELAAGDLLVLATDALAALLLRLDARSRPVWHHVGRLDRAAFTALVAAGIDAGLLERDDVTLVRVRLAGEAGGPDAGEGAA